MQFVDLKMQQKRIKKEIDAKIQMVMDHGKYILGPEVKELEDKIAEYIGIKHAIACSSGTDALLLSLMAYGVGPGDAVFTTPFTFISTAEVISLLGATPVFVDIDPKTYNIDPVKLEKAITDCNHGLKAKAVIAVDLFGLPADYDHINKTAKENGLFVIEDAAQSFGADYKDKKAGSLADINCTSFFPAKPLGCYGDGGMCFTNNDEIAEIIRSLLVHGKGTHKYDNTRIGINGRLDTLQAAILLAKFNIFPEEVDLRQRVAERYTIYLKDKSDYITPYIPTESKSAWAQYSILAQNNGHRADIQTKLKNSGIPTAIYYPKPLHIQTAFSFLGYKEGDFSVSESVSQRIFSVPMHPYLTEDEQRQLTDLF